SKDWSNLDAAPLEDTPDLINSAVGSFRELLDTKATAGRLAGWESLPFVRDLRTLLACGTLDLKPPREYHPSVQRQNGQDVVRLDSYGWMPRVHGKNPDPD